MPTNSSVFVIAKINEADCIGCTKCIDACPVDAIVGAAKQLHTVIEQECIGCKLCVAPCPVDCIVLVPVAEQLYDTNKAKLRHKARKFRLQKNAVPIPSTKPVSEKRDYIQNALERIKAKRNSTHK